MAPKAQARPLRRYKTVAELIERLGVSPERIRMKPAPGTATVDDVVRLDDHEDVICELVDGVLVEKAVGWIESRIACTLIGHLDPYVSKHRLGAITGEAGMLQLFPDQVRIPDVAFTSYKRLPGGRLPSEPVPKLVPDLAVEVLSRSNSPKEVERKRHEYFGAGVRLVWLVDPRKRTVTVHTPSGRPTVLREGQTLRGGRVIPGFSLTLNKLFADLPAAEEPA